MMAVLDRRERYRFYCLVLAGILIQLSDVGFLAALIYILGIYNGSSNSSFLPDVLLQNNAVLLLGLYFILFLAKTALAVLTIKMQLRFAYAVATRISEYNSAAYYATDFKEYSSRNATEFVQIISMQPMQFAQFLVLGVQELIIHSVMIAAIVAAIVAYNPLTFVFLIIFLLPPVAYIFFRLRKKSRHSRETIIHHHQHALHSLYEGLKAYVEANIYGKAGFFTRRFLQHQQKLNDANAIYSFYQQLPPRLIEASAVLGLLLLVIAVNAITDGRQEMLVTIAAFIAAAYKLIPGMVRVINLATQVKTYRAAVLSKLLLAAEERPAGNCAEIESISCENLSFGFGNKPVLRSFNQEFRKGDFKGIKAVSGKGKTTIVNLLLGFLSEEQGRVLYNGNPVQKRQRPGFWQHISYVKQDNFIIADTILKNIILDESHDSVRLSRALRYSGLEAMLKQIEGGLLYRVSENGKNLSGGQRQRVALARALYHDADVYILDESFSELDKDSEKQVLSHFRELAEQGKIVILISHSDDALACCKEVVELN